jgi:RNA polymerase sigma-70 factor (ECF subfamily)
VPARTTAEESDEVLMRRYRDGDEAAFDALFQRHAPRVHGFLLRHVGQRALADDLLQGTWLHVHRARATFRDGERFTPWLYTIANNLRRDEGRRGARERADLSRDGRLPEPRGDQPDHELQERVQAALQAIPESYREVIVLHRWHDLGFVEIARMLGTTEGAVKLRAHRGYLALREQLNKGGER